MISKNEHREIYKFRDIDKRVLIVIICLEESLGSQSRISTARAVEILD